MVGAGFALPSDTQTSTVKTTPSTTTELPLTMSPNLDETSPEPAAIPIDEEITYGENNVQGLDT